MKVGYPHPKAAIGVIVLAKKSLQNTSLKRLKYQNISNQGVTGRLPAMPPSRVYDLCWDKDERIGIEAQGQMSHRAVDLWGMQGVHR
jgi:hypothetical protein